MAEGARKPENIQPILKRRAAISNDGTPIYQDECDASQAAMIQQQRQLFESQLDVFSGDQALDLWDKYIKWTIQIHPEGQKESDLQALLERAVMQFANMSYYNDTRYINLWIKLAQNSTAPADMFRYMADQGVGRTHASLYLTWAQLLEKQGELQQAESVLKEGLSCGAQPLDSIQQYLQSVEVRMSGVVPVEEARSPPRTSQVDLRPRGRKRLGEVQGRSAGMSLQLPSRVPPIGVLPSGALSSGTLPIGALRSQSLPVPGSTGPPLEPELPNTTGQLAGEEVEPHHLQSSKEGGASEDGRKEQSMYCKEELTNGITEFSFEELRAQRYFQNKRKEFDEKIQRMHDVREKLKKEVEEKQRLLQLRQSQPPTPDLVDQGTAAGGTTDPGNQPTATPFQIFCDTPSGSASEMPYGASQPCSSPASNDVFLCPGEKGLSVKIQFPCPSGAVPSENSRHLKRSGAQRWSMTETVVGEVQNKTLCPVPDDTCDFAGSAHMVSTPYRTATSDAGFFQCAPTQDLCVLARTRAPQAEVTPSHKLSPIQEANVEASSSNPSSLGGQSTETHLGTQLPDPSTQTGELVPEDACSLEVRRHLLTQLDVVSNPDFHSEGIPIPCVEENGTIALGSEVISIKTKVLEDERFSIYSGFSQEHHVVLKVDRCALPWDFYMASQLRQRTSPDLDAAPPASCYLFLDACVTVYTVPEHRALADCEDLSAPAAVASVVLALLLLLRSFHSRSLLLGGLQPTSLLLLYREPADSVLCADLSSSLNLDLQRDVTSAQQIPAALRFIQQGVLQATASPYQVDLLCLAELSHLLLTKRNMSLVKDQDGWMAEDFKRDRARSGRMLLWRTFFHQLLNAAGRSSDATLSQLLELMSPMTPAYHDYAMWAPC